MLRALLSLMLLAVSLLPATAQDTQIRFGQSLRLQGAAIEVTSDTLSVDQTSGVTEFIGNVTAVQGELRISASNLRLEYAPGAQSGAQRISRVVATGDVVLVTPAEAVEGQTAVYSLIDQTLELTGDVLLVQGQNMLSGERFVADLATGSGRMSGRVRTIIRME